MDFFYDNYILFWVCILGLCFGSFYNVVILRTLMNESIVFPASKCPKCGNKLKPWHNIPVLSYIFLRGKCAFCKDKISIQYPLIELITMGLFIYSYINFGLEWKTLFVIIISSALLIMSMTDLKEKIVDCNIAIGLGVVGILYNWLVNNTFLDSILGLIAGVVIMEALSALGYLLKKGRAFGEADTFVIGALGACFGLMGVLKVLLYTLVVSTLFIIPIFIFKLLKNNNKIVPILLVLFIATVLVFKTVYQNLWMLGLIIVLGLLLVYFILKNMKTESELTYLPLVPAISLAVLYFLFF